MKFLGDYNSGTRFNSVSLGVMAARGIANVRDERTSFAMEAAAAFVGATLAESWTHAIRLVDRGLPQAELAVSAPNKSNTAAILNLFFHVG